MMEKLLPALQAFGFTAVAFLLSSAATAVTINFDDIERIPVDGCFCDHPLTHEYESRGLVIDNGYLVDGITGDGAGVSGPNALLGGDTLALYFAGDKKPTYVEMYVSAAWEQVVFMDIFGDSGLLFSRKTKGYAGENDSTTYTDNQLVTLFSPSGISHISMVAYYHMRTSALVDNLRYEYDVAEPKAVWLMFTALGGLLLRRRKITLEG